MTGFDSTTSPDPPDPWPIASMSELVTMCTSPALMGLGIVPPPGQEEPELDLPMARHFIDLLALLDEKTADQLDDIEQQALNQALHELRMAFLQVQQAAESQPVATDHDAAQPPDDAPDLSDDHNAGDGDNPEPDDVPEEAPGEAVTDVEDHASDQPDASEPIENSAEDD